MNTNKKPSLSQYYLIRVAVVVTAAGWLLDFDLVLYIGLFLSAVVALKYLIGHRPQKPWPSGPATYRSVDHAALGVGFLDGGDIGGDGGLGGD